MGQQTNPIVEPQINSSATRMPWIRRPFVLLCGVVTLLAAALLVYSVIRAFVWDEGFHLIAAKLINAGKTPYLDFCFPQTLLNAYWNALWLRLFPDSWRAVHVPAALLVIACIFLTGQYVFSRLPVVRWRLACGITAACLLGLSTLVVEFGPIAQAYAMCMLFGFAAFRAAVIGVKSQKSLWAVVAGLCAGISAGATLLSAPVLPVLLLWFFLSNRAGNKWAKCVAYCMAAVVPFTPEIILLVKAPRQTIFNVVRYQAIFRRADWKNASVHDIDVFSGWLDSNQALLIGVLAIAAAVFLIKRKAWLKEDRDEFYLCGWIALALTAYLSTCHPTFERYYVVAVPYFAVLASAGLYFVSAQMGNRDRPFWPATALIVLMALGLAKDLFDDRDSAKWTDYDDLARKVNEVTPRGASLYADELTYFVAKRTPPPGLEFSYSHKVELGPQESALYHIIPWSELDRRLKAGFYQTVEICDDDKIEKLGLADVYAHKEEVGDCTVFWTPNPPGKAKADTTKK